MNILFPICALIFISLSATVRAKTCGSITKDGIEHPIPCNYAQKYSATPSISTTSATYCQASITQNGITKTYNHRCTPKTPSTVPNQISEPSGSFKMRQSQHKNDINRLAKQYDLDPALIHAVISVESAYRSDVVSNKGAVGLMQLMPSTAQSLNVIDSFNSQANLEGGIRYLKQQLQRFNNINLALAAYNAGPNAVIKYNHTIPPYRETQQYVQRVNTYLKHYQSDWQPHIQ